MTRRFFTTLFSISCLIVLNAMAQDEDVLKKPQKKEAVEDTLQKPMPFDPKKVDDKTPPEKLPVIEPIEPIERIEPAKQEDPQEVLERVKENMKASADRLGNKDVGDKTREIQKDILRDLDALINRAEENQSGGGKMKPSLGSQSGKPGSQSQAQKKQSGKQSGSQQTASNSGGKEPQPGKKKEGDAGKKEGDGKAPGAGKKEGDSQPKEGKDGKGGAGGGNSPEKKEINTVADLFKDVWGHLPAAKRQEMDAYSRERFMPRYEDILREYYRTIAERSRRGGN